jgi:UDP-glucose 4-epimerase
VLLTGGAGYIGSHTAVALADAGYYPVLIDNFCNADRRVVNRLRELLGAEGFAWHDGDVREAQTLCSLLRRYRIATVIHFAALKAVGESVAQPLRYFENNGNSLCALLQALAAEGGGSPAPLVYSSSATVYGDPDRVPIPESAPFRPTNPYAWTKVLGEQLVLAQLEAQSVWRAVILRYFKPVGAHPSGRIGEDPQGIPNNLMPFVQQVAVGRRAHLTVFGHDWPTPDGTGVRDYLHVMDLAEGHVRAVDYLRAGGVSDVVNLGTGRGHSVLQLLDVFGSVCGRELACRIGPRRAGDIAVCYADASRARSVLGWEARRDLRQMCEDAWRWQSSNPNGYSGG